MIPMISGRMAALILLSVMCAIFYLCAYLSKKGSLKIAVRRLSALDAMTETVGRAVEMGRPVHFTAGNSALVGSESSIMIAGITLLGFLAKLTAQYKSRLLISVSSEQTLPMHIEIVKQAYDAQGRSEDFRIEDIRYVGSSGYSAAVIQQLVREKVAANIMVGGFDMLSVLLADWGARAGAIQLAGNPRLVQMPYFAVACDYCLYGEEVFAAGAYLSDDPEVKGYLAGQDIVRVLGMVIMVLAAVLLTLGDKTIYRWLGT